MAARPSDWTASPESVKPTVLLIGGFLTSPPFYRPMRRRLLARGAADVLVARIWTPDWLLAGVRGLAPIVGRAADALALARARSAGSPASHGAPLLVIGHSAGGVVARILTAEQPFAGRVHAEAADIGALVTLGSPHHVLPARLVGRRVGDAAARFADRVVPGSPFAPETGYVSVASRAVVGRADGDGRARVAFRLYQALLHEPGATTIHGDGLVPVRSALLEGSRQIVLPDIAHGQGAGRPWYGTDQGLEGWWQPALDAWQAALSARIATPARDR